MIPVHDAVSLATGGVASVLLFLLSFRSKYSGPARWPIRAAMLLIGPLGVAWAVTGWYVAAHPHLAPDLQWHVRFFHISLGGAVLSLFLLFIIISPKSYGSLDKLSEHLTNR
jgi:hypothetical protein